MTTKTFKPSSPGRRHRIGIDFSDLTKSKPEKNAKRSSTPKKASRRSKNAAEKETTAESDSGETEMEEAK